jgi:hypothetical protein
MERGGEGSVALVMTVRDEVEFLRPNLLYHRFLGVGTAYVYDDGSTDGTAESVADLPFVRVAPSVDPASLGEDDADGSAARYVTSRQNMNTLDAMRRARADGAAWLLAIDADELACVDLEAQPPGALAAALATVPAGVEAVVLRALEIVQRRMAFDDVFAGETLFKRADVGLQHRTLDPFTGKMHRVRGVYGHTAGKSAARLAADLRPATVHRFRRRDGSQPPSTDLGWVLHYYCHSFEAFVRKFRLFSDHPDVHLRGHEVQLQKRLWRDVVNRSGMGEEELRDYYRRWVMFDDEAIARLRRPRRRLGLLAQPPALVEVQAARRAFAELRGQAPGPTA